MRQFDSQAPCAPARQTGEPSLLDQCGDTRRRLLESLLHSPDGLTVCELELRLGITATAVRQHLAALECDAYVEHERRPVTRGRPQHRYRLSASGHEVFPRRYDALAASMVTELAESLGEDQLPDAMQRMGKRTAAQLGTSRALSVAETAQLMQQLGYAARREESSVDGDEIVAMNCVFHRLAEQHPSVCEFDLALLESATGKQVHHRECMLRGDQCCRFGFTSKK